MPAKNSPKNRQGNAVFSVGATFAWLKFQTRFIAEDQEGTQSGTSLPLQLERLSPPKLRSKRGVLFPDRVWRAGQMLRLLTAPNKDGNQPKQNYEEKGYEQNEAIACHPFFVA